MTAVASDIDLIYQSYQALCQHAMEHPGDMASTARLINQLFDLAMDHGDASGNEVTVDAAVSLAQRIDGFKLDGIPGSLRFEHVEETAQELVPMLLSRVLVNHRRGEQGALINPDALRCSSAWHRYVNKHLGTVLQASYRLEKIRQDRAYFSAIAA